MNPSKVERLPHWLVGSAALLGRVPTLLGEVSLT